MRALSREELLDGHPDAVSALQAHFDKEASSNGLVEMNFTPGSAREVSQEDAALQALAMLKYKPTVA